MYNANGFCAVFARVLAAFSLISIPVAQAFPDTSGSANRTLLVYVDAGANGPAPTLPVMRREAEKLMRTAGYRLEWRELHARNREAAPDLAVVSLSGACALPAVPATSAVALSDDAALRLASTMVSDGVVLPFSRIDCPALTNLLAPALAREAPGQRTYYYGRAMGRLLAHELYHVLAQTRDHAENGVGKPCFTAADLVSDRFEFESVALARLRRAVPADPVEESASIATRR